MKKFAIALLLLLTVFAFSCAVGCAGLNEDDKKPEKEEPIYTVSFYADDVLVAEKNFKKGDTSIVAPDIPQKAGYSAIWGSYNLNTLSNQRVDATYTLINYEVVFMADNDGDGVYTQVGVTKKYTVINKAVVPPTIPFRTHYTSSWNWGGKSPDDLENITVYAEYTPAEYTIKFVDDGGERNVTYTYGVKSISEPQIKEREHYSSKWGTYTLDGNKTVNAIYTPVEYTIKFVDDGGERNVTYAYGQESIEEPEITERAHYSAKWETYTLDGNKTVNAIYTPLEYAVTFVDDGGERSVTYTYGVKSIKEPQIKERDHYSSKWGTYTLDGNKTVNAIYTAIKYSVTFMADNDGDSVYETVLGEVQYYDIENKDTVQLIYPTIPEKQDYIGRWDWSGKTLDDLENLTVKLVYIEAAKTYTITFYAEGVKVGEDVFTKENDVINEPNVPEKKGYEGSWEEYSLTPLRNISVSAVYVEKQYTITFLKNGIEYATRTYSLSNKTVDVPEVPVDKYFEYAWDWGGKTTSILADFEVNLVETKAKEYHIKFYAGKDEKVLVYEKDYNYYNVNEVVPPTMLEIERYTPKHYSVALNQFKTSCWSYSLFNDTEVYIKYNPIQYYVSFMVNGELFRKIMYTVESESITEPTYDLLPGYYVVWDWGTHSISDLCDFEVYAEFRKEGTIIEFNKEYVIYSKDANKELEDISKMQISDNAFDAFKDIYGIEEGEAIVLPAISTFATVKGSYVKEFSSLSWVYKKADGSVVKVNANQPFKASDFENKEKIVLYIMYSSYELTV